MVDPGVLEKLTLDEKIKLTAGQDIWRTHAFPHVKVPYAKLTDGPNGARGGGSFNDSTPAALYPSPSCLASTFDLEAAQSMGRGIAEDSLSKKCHVSLAPTINMTRDQRYGRAFENYGEDPLLTGLIGAHWTLGCQSVGVAATPKHFVTNEAELDRRFSNSIVSPKALREVYLEPFRRLFQEVARAHRDNKDGEQGRVFGGKPACIMTAYNELDGVSSSENKSTLIDILRKEWKWDGLVMSDWFALHNHGLGGGCDLEMPGPALFRRVEVVKAAIAAGRVTEQDVETAALQVIKLLNKVAPLGFTEAPAEEHERSIVDEGREASIRKIAAEGAVLLKNDESPLPVDINKVKKIALIGKPWKTAIQSGGGSANLTPQKAEAAFGRLRAALDATEAGKSVELQYHEGCDIHNFPFELEGKDVLPSGVKLEYFASKTPSDHPSDVVESRQLEKTTLGPLEPRPEACKPNNFSLRITLELKVGQAGEHTLGLTCLGQGKLTALRTDGTVALQWDFEGEQDTFEYFLNENKRAQRRTLSTKSGDETIQIVLDYTPAPLEGMAEALGGAAFKIGLDRYKDHEGGVREASQLASEADLAIVFTGVGPAWESEGYDRQDLSLPLLQNSLVESVAKKQPRTIVLNASGAAVEMPWLPQVKAVVQAWYGGQEAAEAIVDILLARGDAPASGRLCTTWPHSTTGQPSGTDLAAFPGLPNLARGGHPDVRYIEGRLIGHRWYEKRRAEPLFWFGQGLGGYTTFEQKLVNVSGEITRAGGGGGGGGKITVEVEVHNTGTRSGKCVVQLYVTSVKNDKAGLGDTDQEDVPVKKLAAFAAVRLSAGEKRTVALRPLEGDSFSYWQPARDDGGDQRGSSSSISSAAQHGHWVVEEGEYDVVLAKSASPADEIARKEVRVKESWTWRGLEP